MIYMNRLWMYTLAAAEKGIYKEGCEDSYCIVGMLHPGANLADLAKKYEQESIAVVSAETKFVSAKKANG